MGRNRVVAPGSRKYDLTDGDWVMLKRELNAGDTKKLEAAGLKPPVFVAGKGIISPIDWAVYEFERALIFITGWSLTTTVDKEDQPMPLTFSALASLDTDSFDEINKTILLHADEVANTKKERRMAILKARGISIPDQPTTSPLPSESSEKSENASS